MSGMVWGELSLKERLTLSAAAGRAVAVRLRRLRGHVDAGDRPLVKLLDHLITEKDNYAHHIYRLQAGIPGPQIPPPDEAEALKRHLPSLLQGFGEAPLSRDVAMYLAERMDGELACFYHLLSERATDRESLAFFEEAAEREQAEVSRLRTLLLAV